MIIIESFVKAKVEFTLANVLAKTCQNINASWPFLGSLGGKTKDRVVSI
jgi:hypothetical protein